MGRSDLGIQGDHESDRKKREGGSHCLRYSKGLPGLKKSAARFFTLILVASFCVLPANAKLHKRTKRFIDIEVPKSDVFLYCTGKQIKDDMSLLAIEVLNGNELHGFGSRRAWGTSACEADLAEYLRLMRNVSTVRVVGQISLDEPELLDEVKGLPSDTPKKFRGQHLYSFWYFVRLQTKNGCKSYFTGDCSPENYWADTPPE